MTDAQYPTDEDLKKIEKWDWQDQMGLMEFVKEIWWHGLTLIEGPKVIDDHGEIFSEYTLHTGGWSGNEEIIHSLEQNYLFTGMSWYSSKRGGHHVYRIRHIKKN